MVSYSHPSLMIIVSWTQFHFERLWEKRVEGPRAEEKALVGAFSVIRNLRMDLFEALIVSPSLLGSFIRIFFSLHNTTITMHTQRPDYWRFWAPNAGSGPWHRNGRSENWRKCRLFIGFPMFASQSFSIIVSNLLFLEILWQRKRSYFVFCSTKLPFPKLTFRCLQQKRV